MKYSDSHPKFPSRPRVAIFSFIPVAGLLILGIFFATPQSAAAATFTWTGASAVDSYWTTPDNWGGAAPSGTGTDDLVFPDGAALISTSSNDFPAATTFNSIQFSGTTAGYTLSGNQITLGTGGISSANTSATNTVSLAVVIDAVRTVTVSDAAGTLEISGIISGSGGVTKAGPGQLNVGGVNSFTGGLIIQAGTVVATTSNKALGGLTGTGTVTIGDTSGNADATLINAYWASPLANPIVLATGTTGTLSVGGGGISNATFTGGVTGANNLTLKNNSTSTGQLAFSTASINNIGTITSSGSSSGSTVISGGVGSNVTAITQSSTTSQLLFNTNPITINSGGTTLTVSPGAKKLSVYASVDGTGNLILNNNSSLTMGIDFPAIGSPVNNIGSITNSGSGTGTVNISGGVGSNVTAITQSSTTSALDISTNPITVNSVGTTLTVDPGSKSLAISGGSCVVGAGNLILKNNSSLTSGLAISCLVNNIGSITNSGSGLGSVVISKGIGSNVTAITQSSTTAQFTIQSVPITVNSGGTTLTVSPGAKKLAVYASVDGTGDLILNNNGSLAGGITLASISVNNTGTITNSGSGTGSMLVSANVLPNVAGIEQNSPTSPLTLSGTNTFTGGVILNSGTLNINSSTALGDAAGTFTINGGTIDNTSAGAITTNNYPMNWNGDFNFTGTKDLNLGTGTVTMGADTQAMINAGTLAVGSLTGNGYELTKAGSGTLAFVDDSTLSVGSLDILGGTLNSGNSSIDVTGTGLSVWNNAGTFSSTGTVTFSGARPQIGDSNFNDLTIVNNADFTGSSTVTGTFTDNTGGSILSFNPGSTYSFANIDINGTVGNNIIMTSPGPWFFNVAQAAPTVSQVSVDHSNAAGGNTITANGNSINNGDNINWLFVPDAPTIGIATGGDAQATVTFAAPASDGGTAITGYTVTSIPDGGVDADAGTMSLSHTITGLANGTSYTFTVTATSGIGTSAPSAESNAIMLVTVPDAPIIGTVTGGDAQATVTFAAPASDGGTAITGYTVTSIPAGGVDSDAGTTSLSHTITGLANRTSYTFTVKATNSVGTSNPSAESNSVMLTPQSGSGGSGWTPSCSGTSCNTTDDTMHPANPTPNQPENLICARSSDSTVPFEDITNHWARADIEGLYRRCIVDGRTSDLFVPDGESTRAELVKIVLNTEQLGIAPFEPIFLDVFANDWFAGYVIRAAKLGIVEGYINLDGITEFKPRQISSRAEALKVILKAEDDQDFSGYTADFHDVHQADWFYDYVAYAEARGMVEGYTMVYDKSGAVSKYYSFPRLLGFSNQGKDVSNLKKIMAQLGYYQGEINTDYDVELESAISAYQRAKAIKSTGQMGYLTRRYILKENLEPVTYKYFRPNSPITRAEIAKLVTLVQK